MKLRYNGHSSFTIIAADGTTIVTDPYEPGCFGGALNYHQIDSTPDVVTVSHDHADHNYTGGFAGDYSVLKEGGRAKGIEFTTLDTFHDENKGADRGANKIFVFAVDGIRICHLGDLGHNLSDDQIKALGEVDVLLPPVGGFFTIDANTATDIVERLRPKLTVPMHFKTNKVGFPISEVGAFTEGKNNVKFIEADEIELSADQLPGEPEILVLKHRL